MSGKQEKLKRRSGEVISIAARRGQRQFDRLVEQKIAEIEDAHAVRRSGHRVALAILGLSIAVLVIVRALVG